jgi:hypothetical protein
MGDQIWHAIDQAQFYVWRTNYQANYAWKGKIEHASINWAFSGLAALIIKSTIHIGVFELCSASSDYKEPHGRQGDGQQC